MRDAKELAQQIGVSEEVITEAAEACARRLAEWFGSAEAAADALMQDPVDMVGIALTDHTKAVQGMAVAAHQNPGLMSAAVLGIITGQAAH